jgi:hypothetical protein
MSDMNRRVAEALDVLPLLLVVGVYLGLAVLAIGGMAKVPALGYVAMLLGIGITAVGLRAAIRQARSFDTGTPLLQRHLGTTRAVGVFYAVAGFLWTLLGFGVTQAG